MSSRSAGLAALLCSIALLSSPVCWEQMDGGKWFPQMKVQPALAAFEEVVHNGQLQGFSPPEGTVPVGGSSRPDLAAMTMIEQDALENPVPATLSSLKNGEVMFQRFCATCHGAEGMGDGPVAASSPFAPHASGPLPLVLPINGPMSMANVFSDGHIYTTISSGRGRMPRYARIPAADRWDIVNFLRELNRPGGPQ